MKRFSVVLIVSWLSIFAAAAQTDTVRIGNADAHPTRILAKYKSSRQVLSAQESLIQADSRVERRSVLAPRLVVLEENESSPTRLSATASSEERRTRLLNRIEALKASGLFEYVEPDYIVHADAAPNDAAFLNGSLWGLLNYGQSSGKSGADIGATNAWEITTGDTNVIVAVIDTGIRYTHDDLALQMWRNPKPGSFPGFTNDIHGINAIRGTGDPMDDIGHGTHVAGTIGAAEGDGNPMVGVAWHVRLMACKFLGQGGGLTSDAITCIDYAVSNGARILNNSWGGGAYSRALYDAIDEARKKGVLFIAAAGNDGMNNDMSPHYPANYPLDNIISVAALDRNDLLADFSDFGYTTVHVGAPGVEIFSCYNSSDSSYALEQGTSMAAPHVSGVAALLLSRRPSAQMSELRQRILLGVVPVPALAGRTTTGGRVNAYNSLTVTGSGLLHASIDPASGSSLLAGSAQTLTVNLTDLFGVTDGTVSASVAGVTNLVFRNDGTAPDLVSNDSIYSVSFNVPSNLSSVSLTVVATAPGKIGVTNLVQYSILPPPPNDMFAASTKMPAAGGISRVNNRFATLEPGERPHGANPDAAASLWWIWSPATTTSVIIDTTGSAVDNILDVYTNSTLATLREVASDTSTLSQHQPAHVTFTAQAGQVYHIAISSVDTNSLGTLQLRITPDGHLDVNPPSVFIASPVSGTTVGSRIITLTGVALDSPPDVTGVSEVFISVNGDLPNSVNGTTNWSGPALLRPGFNSITATAYDFAGNASPPATIQINYLLQEPANDIFVNGTVLAGTSGTISLNTTNATKEIGEPNHAGLLGGKSVWWTFAPAVDGLLTLSTTNSSFDTVLGLYTGNRVDQLTLVASNDDAYPYAPGGFSQIAQAVKGGTTYRIAADAFDGAGGDMTLTWSFRTGALYHVTVSSSTGGRVSPGSADVSSNAVVVFTAIPDPGYRFDMWTGGVTSLANPLTNIIRGDFAITASFVPEGTISDDFESGGLTKLPWTTSGDQAWSVQNSVVSGGLYAAQSGAIANNQTSILKLSGSFNAREGSFDLRTSSEPVWDRLSFYIDNALIQQWSGETAWRTYAFPVPAGTHTLEWRYAKDGAGSSGLDAAFIDNVQLPFALPIDASTPATLKMVRQTDGSYFIELIGQINQVYTLQISSELSNWTDVSSATCVTGTLRFPEPARNNSTARYYRAVVK